ncbi:hypothetical protein AB0K74_44860, partial [Streptomyces sp. NPDC056159]
RLVAAGQVRLPSGCDRVLWAFPVRDYGPVGVRGLRRHGLARRPGGPALARRGAMAESLPGGRLVAAGQVRLPSGCDRVLRAFPVRDYGPVGAQRRAAAAYTPAPNRPAAGEIPPSPTRTTSAGLFGAVS